MRSSILTWASLATLMFLAAAAGTSLAADVRTPQAESGQEAVDVQEAGETTTDELTERERRKAERQAARAEKQTEKERLKAEKQAAKEQRRAEKKATEPGRNGRRSAAGPRSGRRSTGGGRGDFSRTHADVSRSSLATQPEIKAYIDRIDSGEAGAADYASLANAVARGGLVRQAAVYYNRAVRMEPANALLWLNLGTLQQQTGDHGAAAKSFSKAISLDPGNALAHYNLGVSLNAMGNYDEAIEEFSSALLLDPDLADPGKNPQVVNNELLLPVQLELYKNRQGASGLPLVEMPEGGGSN